MKTHPSLLVLAAASFFFTGVAQAQPAFSRKPAATTAEKRAQAVWEQVQKTASLYQSLSRMAPDPADLGSYAPIQQRLLFIAASYAAIDLSAADADLRKHVENQIKVHKAMAQAFGRAAHEFVPALQATLSELRHSDRAHALAAQQHFDLQHATLTEDTLALIAALSEDAAFAAESRWLSKQTALITAAAASFQQAEENLRYAQAAHERIAIVLAVKYGGDFTPSQSFSSLWVW